MRSLSKYGVAFIAVNVSLLAMAHYVPNLLGRALPPGDVGYTRLTGLVRTINLPVFWLFQSGVLYPSEAALKLWPASRALAYNVIVIILLAICFAAYWYLEGLMARLLVCKSHILFVRRRNTKPTG